ncbi:Integrase core domain protein [Bremerella volcania]|uniref:Integrase core domain protein n=1 Tax=Bremerella volcania TaxID=2527984 RepID=A0A518CC80_9BACT|nr:integrase core domain-containing protein [Bremerella volcania]QDU76833.1 Integrase core domain protein [Bremerella volcania]
MRNVYQSLLLLIAGATQQELARQVRYLKVENEILRSKLPKRVTLTPKEKNRLAKFAAKLGSALNELATIAHPSTIRRWIREAAGGVKKSVAKRGRPKTKEEIRELVLKMARGNDWGYTRIMGELKKLGITPPSRNTIKNILKENGLDPGPKRGEGTWDDFLKQHASTLWQCDFYAKKALTLKGFRDLYILVFLHVESRRVYITPSTFHPNEEWVKQQAVAFLDFVKESDLDIKLLMHDRDTKFTASFDALFDQAGAKMKQTAFRSPNTNAFVERYIQTLQQEVLDHFIVFGEQHMDHIVAEAVEHYHEERPHQSKDNELLIKPPDEETEDDSGDQKYRLHCNERLGGLLKHYYLKAA